jgi:Uma2 family endonuclease
MALAAQRDARMHVAEFRHWAEGRPDAERWELLDGEPALFSPPRERRQATVANRTRRISDLADGKGGRAMPGLGIVSAERDDFVPIPDGVVRCGPPLPDGDAEDPLLVAEVLSPPTMSLDRGRKIDFYRTVPSLKVLLIVYSDEMRVDVRRREASDWAVRASGSGGSVALPELDGTVPVSDIYRGLAV